MDSSQLFNRTAAAYVSLVQTVGPTQWDQPGLGEWTVKELVGHTARAISLVGTYASPGAGTPTVGSAIEYFALALSMTDSAAIAQRGRDAGAAIGSDPGAAVASMLEAVQPVFAAPHHVASPAGAMTLDAYLDTRVLELVVHGDDLARAIERDWAPPEEAVQLVVATLVALALRRGDGVGLVRALSGRAALPAGFTVL